MDWTPEQEREASSLTKQGYRNLKIVADKWAGLRREGDKVLMYVGLTVEGNFDRCESHEELRTALAAIAAHPAGLTISGFGRSPAIKAVATHESSS